jgi:large subunit ribosomal protein L20
LWKALNEKKLTIMPRSANKVAARHKKKKLLKLTRGYFGSRKNVYTVAKNTWEKGQTYAYRDRRNKKREFRKLWIQRINAGTRQYGMNYSQFIGKLNEKDIKINRKVLADLAMNNPDAFKAIIDSVQ